MNTYHPAQAKEPPPRSTSQPTANSPAEQHKTNPVHHHSTPHQRQDRLLHRTLSKWFQKRQELRRHCMGTTYAYLSGDDKEMGLPQDGTDMSRALDTTKRKRILDVLLQAGCNDDELRLVRTRP